MNSILVLGLIPGTSFYISFDEWLAIVTILWGGISIYRIERRLRIETATLAEAAMKPKRKRAAAKKKPAARSKSTTAKAKPAVTDPKKPSSKPKPSAAKPKRPKASSTRRKA